MGNLANNYASWHMWISTESSVHVSVTIEVKGCDEHKNTATPEDVERSGALLRLLGEAIAQVKSDYEATLTEGQ